MSILVIEDDEGVRESLVAILRDEGYEIASEDVGGAYARRVMYKPYSGRAMIKRLDSAAATNVAREELTIVGARQAPKPPAPALDDIELF